MAILRPDAWPAPVPQDWVLLDEINLAPQERHKPFRPCLKAKAAPRDAGFALCSVASVTLSAALTATSGRFPEGHIGGPQCFAGPSQRGPRSGWVLAKTDALAVLVPAARRAPKRCEVFMPAIGQTVSAHAGFRPIEPYRPMCKARPYSKRCVQAFRGSESGSDRRLASKKHFACNTCRRGCQVDEKGCQDHS